MPNYRDESAFLDATGMLMENGHRVIKPMRCQCLIAVRPTTHVVKFHEPATREKTWAVDALA